MKSAVKAVCVDPARVGELWGQVAPLIKSAVERGGISDFATVEHNVRNGSVLLWLAWDGTEICACAATELSGANGKKNCTIVACAGKQRGAWLPLIADLESYAKAEGCHAMLIFGRRGWEREIANYRVKGIILEKELN